MKGVCKDEMEVIEHIKDVAVSVLLEFFLDTVDTAGLGDDRIIVCVCSRVGHF